jgi:hypothetical protein
LTSSLGGCKLHAQRRLDMKKKIQVWEATETVSIFTSDQDGSYRIIWHRTDGPHEEFVVTPEGDDTVEEAVAKDLRGRMGP